MLVCTLPSPACMCSATQDAALEHALVDLVQLGPAPAGRPAPLKIVRQRCLAAGSSSWRAGGGPAVAGTAWPRWPASPAHWARTCCTSAWPGARGLRSSSALEMSSASSLLAQRQVGPGQKRPAAHRTAASLLRSDQLDVDALDAVGVLRHARQRNHHVLVDLEGVGVAWKWPPCACDRARISCAPRC